MKYIGLFDEKEDIVTKEKLETKQDVITGAATTITDDNLTASRALVSDTSGKVTVSPVTSTELGYLDGVTSNVQTQLDSKQGNTDEIQASRLRGGFSSVISTDSAVSISQSINAMGFAMFRGATAKIFYDDYEMPFPRRDFDALFDGKSTTQIEFGNGPSDYYDSCVWKNTQAYVKGALVTVYTGGRYRWYKALLENTGVNPVGDESGTWEDISATSNGRMKFGDMIISIDITFPTSIRYDNGLSLYWRTTNNNCKWLKVEKYAEGIGWFTVTTRDNIPMNEIVNTVYMARDGGAEQKRLRVSFKPQQDNGWCGLNQLAITGNIGGIEGTLVNRGGSTMYGNLSPYTSGGASLGTSSAPWNEVRANKFIGDGSNLTNIPYPVTSVNTKTGAVTLSASDVGAQPTITVNGIIKGDGAGNLSAQDTVTAELVDLPTVPTKVSELENDANYITAAQAPVQSVNNKTGAVSLTASDVSAIPSTLTGTAGQVLTKTADGQEWADAASPDLSNYIKLNTSENQVGYRPSGELQLYFGGSTSAEATNSLIMREDTTILGNPDNHNAYSAGLNNSQILLACGNHVDENNKLQTAMLFQLEPTSTTLLSEGAIEVGLMKPETITTDYSISNPITTDTQASNIRAGLVLEPKNDTTSVLTLVNNDATSYIQFNPETDVQFFAKNCGISIQSEEKNITISGGSEIVLETNGLITLAGEAIWVNSKRITGVALPILNDDAANKEYVDSFKPKATKITLTVSGWGSTLKTQSVTVSGVLSDVTKQEIRVMPVDTALDSPYIASGVQCVAQGSNNLTFACDKIPTEAIEVYVVMQDVNYS